jgi:WD40 repeat protein
MAKSKAKGGKAAKLARVGKKKGAAKPAASKKKPAARKGKGKAGRGVIPAKGALAAVIPGGTRVAFMANGRAVLVARQGKKTLTLWDLETNTETPPLKALPTFSAVALSADNRYIAMGTSTGILAVESTQAGKVAWKTRAGGEPVGDILFTLDGSLVIAAAEYAEEGDAWIRVHKTATGEEERAFDPVAGARCCHLALSPDGLFLAHSEVRSNSVLIWHLPTRQMGACIRLDRRQGRITGLAFGIGVRHFFVAQERAITGWNAENGTALAEMRAEGIRSLAVIRGGDVIASLRMGAEDAAINIWGAETGHLRKTIPVEVSEAGPLAAPPGGGFLALPTGKECWIWNVEKLVG